MRNWALSNNMIKRKSFCEPKNIGGRYWILNFREKLRKLAFRRIFDKFSSPTKKPKKQQQNIQTDTVKLITFSATHLFQYNSPVELSKTKKSFIRIIFFTKFVHIKFPNNFHYSIFFSQIFLFSKKIFFQSFSFYDFPLKNMFSQIIFSRNFSLFTKL